jgi:hypothetical protein
MTVENKTNSQVDGEQSDLVELPDGTTVSVDELMNGYMRQSDYTKKTQALAQEKQALSVTNANQQVDESLNSDPERSNENVEMTKMFLDMKMAQLKVIHGESFDEVAVLNKASDMLNKGIKPTDIDFDFIARGLSTSNDTDDLEAKIRAKLIAEMNNVGVDTSSIISGADTGGDVEDGTFGLSPDELEYCRKTGEKPEIYSKWKFRKNR